MHGNGGGAHGNGEGGTRARIKDEKTEKEAQEEEKKTAFADLQYVLYFADFGDMTPAMVIYTRALRGVGLGARPGCLRGSSGLREVPNSPHTRFLLFQFGLILFKIQQACARE